MSKRIVRLTESELINLVKRVVKEQSEKEDQKMSTEMEEGWLGDMGRGIRRFATGHSSSEERESKKQKLEDELDEISDLVRENPEAFFKGDRWDNIEKRYRQKMEDNNYRGYFTIDGRELDDPDLEEHIKKTIEDGRYEMVVLYNEVHTKAQQMGSGAGSATRSYQSKAQSNESYYRRRNRLR